MRRDRPNRGSRARAGRRLWGAALAIAVAGGAPGVALAQAPAGGADPLGADAGLSRQVTLSPAEMTAQADGHQARLETGRTVVAKQLAEARQQRDVVKTLCLNDKLNQLDVAMRNAQERRSSLDLALKRGDQDSAGHELTIMTVLRQRADQLTSEANQCVGEEAGFVGDSSVNMTVEGVPDEDAEIPPSFNVFVDPPGCSSCFD